MQDFIEAGSDWQSEGCLLIIYRIRNNLLHGLKIITELNEQITLFREINKFLEKIN